MKKHIITLVTLFFTMGVLAQSLSTIQKDDPQLAAIDKLKDDINNNLSSFKKVERFNDKTGYHRIYYLENELQLVSILYRDTITEKTAEWYFQRGQLIYYWQLWKDIKTNDTLDYERFYLRNERLIAWLKFDNSVDRNSVVFKKLNFRMRDYIADLRRENQR